MAPLLVLIGSTLLLRAAGALRVRAVRSWTDAARGALALMLVFTAYAHFAPGLRDDLVRMVPPGVGNAGAWVTLTGILEIAGAAGILVPRTRRLAGACVALLMVAMFPANVRAAREGLEIGGNPATALPLRAALQVVFIAWTLWVSQARSREPTTPRRRGEDARTIRRAPA